MQKKKEKVVLFEDVHHRKYIGIDEWGMRDKRHKHVSEKIKLEKEAFSEKFLVLQNKYIVREGRAKTQSLDAEEKTNTQFLQKIHVNLHSYEMSNFCSCVSSYNYSGPSL